MPTLTLNHHLRLSATSLLGALVLTLALVAFPSLNASIGTHHGRPSISSLKAAERALVANRSALQKQGISLQSVAFDQARSGLIVGLTPGEQGSLKALQDEAPGIPIRPEYIRTISANASVGDGPPWLTGMDLYDLYGQGGSLHYTECTSGFNVINPQTKQTFVTTAAHCFNSGTQILHADGRVAQQVGPVVASSGYNSNADSELIASAAGTTPNTILVNNSRQVPVSSYYPLAATGTSLCKSGIATGETCGNVVSNTNATVCYSSGCFSGQEETTNSTTSEAAYLGDSGGPVYAYAPDGSVIAAGTVSGFQETCDASGRGCGLDGVMYFTPIQNIQQRLGVLP